MLCPRLHERSTLPVGGCLTILSAFVGLSTLRFPEIPEDPFFILWTLRRGDLVLARSLLSAEPSPHDEGFKENEKCRPRARTTRLPSRGSDLLHHLHPFFRFFRNFRETWGKVQRRLRPVDREAGPGRGE